MSAVSTPMPVETEEPDQALAVDRPWSTVVWNDPVNLMSYVTYVFQDLLRLPEEEGARS